MQMSLLYRIVCFYVDTDDYVLVYRIFFGTLEWDQRHMNTYITSAVIFEMNYNIYIYINLP